MKIGRYRGTAPEPATFFSTMTESYGVPGRISTGGSESEPNSGNGGPYPKLSKFQATITAIEEQPVLVLAVHEFMVWIYITLESKPDTAIPS